MSKWFRRIPWLVIPVMLLSFTIANAQQLTGTLSGITADQTDARVPGAKVVVTNASTGDVRETKSDNQGFFSVTALIPGTYKVTISAKSFASWEMNDILVNQGDSRTIPNIHLKIGSEATAVTVISGADAEIPVDTAEVSATLNNELVDSATLTGRNAAELIKMMPGVTFNNGGNAGSGYNSQVTGTNNGPAGSFSANGTQPYGSTDVYLDGANLIDPGNAGTQVANINQDMTDSVKYLSASYGAEYAKGPAVLQAFSKSGGQKFHGEGYLYARNTAVGYANDWFNKANQIAADKPNTLTPQSFYYVGGNVGGPIFFPHFNHNRDKLFFWAGYEYMDQHPYNAPVEMNVPTAAQQAGDYRNIGVDPHVLSTYSPTYTLPCSNTGAWDEGCSDLTISPWNTPGQDFSNLSAVLRSHRQNHQRSESTAEPDSWVDQRVEQLSILADHSSEPLGSYRQGNLRLQRQQQAVGFLHTAERDRFPSTLYLVGTGMDHPISLRTDRQGNRSRLPGKLHSRVQRHDDERGCVCLLRVRQQQQPEQCCSIQPQSAWTPGRKPVRISQD